MAPYTANAVVDIAAHIALNIRNDHLVARVDVQAPCTTFGAIEAPPSVIKRPSRLALTLPDVQKSDRGRVAQHAATFAGVGR